MVMIGTRSERDFAIGTSKSKDGSLIDHQLFMNIPVWVKLVYIVLQLKSNFLLFWQVFCFLVR